jgi:HTH-type transcriptional regulator, osmoprotectant uptake regulator
MIGPIQDTDDSSAERTRAARRALLEGVGKEVAASFPGITRLGGQIVAALYLSDTPQSMDQLSAELGRSKSNIFANLRALDAAQIVERRREPGARYDTFALRGEYPDVIVGAYITRLRRVVADKQQLVHRSLALLHDARGPEADALRKRLDELGRKYRLFAEVFDKLLPGLEGPIDLERLIRSLPNQVFVTIGKLAQAAVDLGHRWSTWRDKS